MKMETIRDILLIVLLVVYYILSDISQRKHADEVVDEINNAIKTGNPSVGYGGIRRLTNSIWKDSFYMAILIYAVLAK